MGTDASVVEKEELVIELRGKKQKPAMTQKHYMGEN